MALEMITLFIPLVTFAGNGFTVVRFQPSHLVAWDRQPEVPAEIQACLGLLDSLDHWFRTEHFQKSIEIGYFHQNNN